MNDNPFFMNFNVSDFMANFAIPGMDNEYSKKLMDIHQKNLDAYVSANKVVSKGYQAIATAQMTIFQESLTSMAKYNPENASSIAEESFKAGTEKMQQLLEMASKAHKEAFDILSARTKDMMQETKI